MKSIILVTVRNDATVEDAIQIRDQINQSDEETVAVVIPKGFYIEKGFTGNLLFVRRESTDVEPDNEDLALLSKAKESFIDAGYVTVDVNGAINISWI